MAIFTTRNLIVHVGIHGHFYGKILEMKYLYNSIHVHVSIIRQSAWHSRKGVGYDVNVGTGLNPGQTIKNLWHLMLFLFFIIHFQKQNFLTFLLSYVP